MITIKILNEDQISWQQQNKIHELLNVTFKNKSQKFIAKTYANIRPHARIIYFEDEQPIAHLGIHNDTLHIGKITAEVTCLGLWCAINNSKRLATAIMKTAYEYLHAKEVKLGFGVTNSQVVLQYILPQMRHITLDIGVKGKNTISKPNDKTIFFGIEIDDDEFKQLEKEALVAEAIYLNTEVF